MMLLASVAFAVNVCPPETVDDVPGCKTLQQALEQAPRNQATVFDMQLGVYRGPVTIDEGRTIIINGLYNATFAASASDPRFDGRQAQFEVDGGALVVNQATLAPVNLGAVYVAAGQAATLRESTVAPSGAGWGLWLRSASRAEVRDSLMVGGVTFIGPHALVSGGQLDIFDSQFVAGVATETGGSLLVDLGGEITADNCVFAGNQALSGGAIDVYDGTVTIRRSTFSENTASTNGGAIHVDDGGAFFGDTLEFEENVALDGGGLHLAGGEAEVRVATFCKNAADQHGGAVNTGAAQAATLSNIRFLDNVAERGGAVALTAPGGRVTNASFLGNRATTKGASVYAAAGADDGRIDNALFAYSSGSIGVSTDGGDLTVRNSLHHANEIGNLGLDVLRENLFNGDPLLRGYTPGQSCGLINDLHNLDSPLTVLPLDNSVEDVDDLVCETPVLPGGPGILDSVPDWGAYGGPCGFGPTAWSDGDDDGVAAIYDCDDEDPTVSPLAEEIWYDGIDQNCDADNDFDADRDGYDAGPDDCDDGDPDVNRFVDDDDPFRDLDCDEVEEDEPIGLKRERIACSQGAAPAGGFGLLAGMLVAFARRRAR